MAQHEGNLALDVLLQNYLDAVAGAGFEVALLGKVAQLQEKRYAPRLVSAVPASLAGREALAAIIEIANVDEVLVAPDARRQRIKIVIIRSGFTHLVRPNKLFPVMLVAGYSNQPDYFVQNQPDFDGLLQRFEITGHSGYIEGPNRQLLPVPAPQLETETASEKAIRPPASANPGITE